MSLSVGVVVPNFRGGRFLRECLDSLLSQDYPNLRIIVMDGGSDDDSVEILRSYGDRICWVSEPDKGQSDAINKGLERLDTDLVGWLNSDDALLPGAVSRIVEAAQLDPLAVLFHGDLDVVDVDGNWLASSESIDLTYDLMRSGRGRTLQPGSFYRASAVKRVGGVNREFYLLMDVDLWIRLLQGGSARRVPAKLARFRVHAEAKSSEKPYRYYKETVMLGIRHERDRMLRASLRRSAQVVLHYARRSLGVNHAQQRWAIAARQRVGQLFGAALAQGRAAVSELRRSPGQRGEELPDGERLRPSESAPEAAPSGAPNRELLDFMHAYLRSGDTVFDVGAREGAYAVLAGKLVGESGRVVAFEADAAAGDRLLENVRCSAVQSVELRRVLPAADQEAASTRSLFDGTPVLGRLAIDRVGGRVLQGSLGRWAHALPVWLLEATSPQEMDVAAAALTGKGYVLAQFDPESQRLSLERARHATKNLVAVREADWEWVADRLGKQS